MQVVNPANPVPKYLQISEWLKELIQSGSYNKGDKLPSEIELSNRCGVNRNTLRQAVSELVALGMLKKVRGVGSFVESVVPLELKHPMNRISSFRDYFGSDSIDRKTIVLEKKIETAGKRIAEALVLANNKKVIALKRLRTGDGVPFIYEESYLPHEMFPGLTDMDLTRSLYRTLTENFNVRLAHSRQKIRAVNLNREKATLFNLPENAAGFFLENITYNENKVPIEILYSYCRGDKYVFELELGEYEVKKNNFNFYVDK